MRNKIIELSKKWGADLVGFAPIERFPEDSAVRKLMPDARTVIGLGFRVCAELTAESRKEARIINTRRWAWKTWKKR